MDYQKKRFLNTTAQFHPNETLISKKNSKSNEKTKKLAIPKYIQDQNVIDLRSKNSEPENDYREFIKMKKELQLVNLLGPRNNL